MFFIIGLTDRTRTAGSGEFFCPREAGRRSYRRVEARRWLTLFFIPLVPVGRQRAWVECGGCGTTYDPGVLTGPAASMQDWTLEGR